MYYEECVRRVLDGKLAEMCIENIIYHVRGWLRDHVRVIEDRWLSKNYLTYMSLRLIDDLGDSYVVNELDDRVKYVLLNGNENKEDIYLRYENIFQTYGVFDKLLFQCVEAGGYMV